MVSDNYVWSGDALCRAEEIMVMADGAHLSDAGVVTHNRKVCSMDFFAEYSKYHTFDHRICQESESKVEVNYE